jgi:putative IMPACT (imprinted ancient) family translation regulator
VLVVVVRYFGGTLLGVRGLIDAYGGAAAEALAASTFEPLPILNSLVVKSHYERFAELQKILNETGLKPEITYDDDHLIMTLIADQELIAIASEKFKSLYDIQIKVN